MDITILRGFTTLENYTGREWGMEDIEDLSESEKEDLLYFEPNTFIDIKELKLNVLYCLTTIHDNGSHKAWLNIEQKEVEKIISQFSEYEIYYMFIHKMSDGIPFFKYFNEKGEKI